MRFCLLNCIIVFLYQFSLSENVQANNNYFLPGDAFFHTTLMEKNIIKLEENPQHPFYYTFVGEFAFCGYAGYSNLSLEEQNRELSQNIIKAYRQLRERIPLELRIYKPSPDAVTNHAQKKPDEVYEMNGFSLFFFNEQYDWQREKIGLKYNEGWLKDMNQFGYKSGRYCPVIESADAIIASWAKGSSVPPLAVQLPDTPIRKYKTVDTPMIPTGRLKAVVLFDQKYKEYFNMKNNKQLLEVTSKGIIHYVIHRREWKIYKDLVEE